MSEAVSVGTSLSLPVAEDQDAGVNGRLGYQLRPVAAATNGDADDVFELVQRLNAADGSTDLQLVLKTALDREQVIIIIIIIIVTHRRMVISVVVIISIMSRTTTVTCVK